MGYYKRQWFNDETKKYVDKIEQILPQAVVETTLNLIEEMDNEYDIIYRQKLIEIVYTSLTSPSFSYSCNATTTYNVFHEFCIYLEGWTWKIEAEDAEHDTLMLVPMK